MPNNYSWEEKLNRSEETDRVAEDIRHLKEHFPNAIHIGKNQAVGNDGGIDYCVCFPNHKMIFVDVKNREKGVSQHWKPYKDTDKKEPELTLEVWSKKEAKMPGWTLDASKKTDYVLFAFDEADNAHSYIFPLADLRNVLTDHLDEWAEMYGYKECTTDNTYTTVSLFIPLTVVWDAIIIQTIDEAAKMKRVELGIPGCFVDGRGECGGENA